MIEQRARDPIAAAAEVAWLQPYPDALLDELPAADGEGGGDPAAIAERRDSVALAFVAALQTLPATQRAVLILREVLDWPARDVADLLGTTVAAVNSAAQRARATLPARSVGVRGLDERQREVLDAFMRAWRARDIPALAALLHEDVILAMPPQSILIGGRDAVAAFFATVPADGRLDLIRLIETSANGRPALAAYLPDDTGDCRGYGIMVVELDGAGVAAITGFPDPELFPAFGLPLVAPAARAGE
jgi:RNA polymerase sigma-70 factor (ECF subfamily)